MSIVIDIDHEGNDLSEYDSYMDDGGDLSTVAPGLAGTNYCLSMFIDDTNALRGQKGVTKVNTFRLRYYINPNTLSMATNDNFVHHYIAQSSGSYFSIVNFYLFKTAGGYQISVNFYKDGGGLHISDTCAISDAEHYIEYELIRASSDIASDGYIEWWVDGVSQGSNNVIDNWNLMGDTNWNARFGAELFSVTATSGTFYLDEIIANDSGNEIGPLGGGDQDIYPSSISSAEVFGTSLLSAVAYPDSDVSIGSWTDQSGGTSSIHDTIDEVYASDSDYVKGAISGVDNILEVGLTNVSDPGIHTYHRVHYRYRKLGSGKTAKLTVALIQNTTTIASWIHNDVSESWADATQTLTEPEASNITDYTDLRLRFTVVEV